MAHGPLHVVPQLTIALTAAALVPPVKALTEAITPAKLLDPGAIDPPDYDKVLPMHT